MYTNVKLHNIWETNMVYKHRLYDKRQVSIQHALAPIMWYNHAQGYKKYMTLHITLIVL